MLEQLSTAVTFLAFYTNDGAGATGLTVTVDVRRASDGTEVVTAASATEVGDGLYKYTLASGSTGTESEYVAIFKTAGTVDQAHLPSLWSIGRAGVENLDATISSRASGTSLTTLSGLVDDLEGRLTSGRAALLDNLDAAISSRASAANLQLVDDFVDGVETLLANISRLDVAVSTRATEAQVIAAVAAVAGGGGSVEDTVTVEDDDGDPLDGVSVTVTTSNVSPGTGVVATGATDAFGEVTFLLDPGTYYVWKQRAGINFTNPESWVVSA